MNTLLQKLSLYFHTLRYLRARQIYYQLYYKGRRSFPQSIKNFPFKGPPAELNIVGGLESPISFKAPSSFKFLNLTQDFSNGIDWDFLGYGKLWSYNLNYFDFLNQPGMSVRDGLRLIKDFCARHRQLEQGREPYPISLRGISWIKFFSRHKVKDPAVDQILFNDYSSLERYPEFHLLGNHLLENGFSLLFAAYYFRSERFYRRARAILEAELKEQILQDGGHFELSPMYHQILLSRLLDCISLTTNNPWKQDELLPFLTNNASRMLGWLENTTFSNGDVPMVNDAAFGIAPRSNELFDYAKFLGITTLSSPLTDSGYRMIEAGSMEAFVDVGNIGPDYIPGHAHSDTFSFVLYDNGCPVIVDTGTSTYEVGAKRMEERSTRAHNTVFLNQKDQSRIWGGFRVAQRAKITSIRESNGLISAAHDGYASAGLIHERSFAFGAVGKIEIVDQIHGNSASSALASLHFFPSVVIFLHSDFVLADKLKISFEGCTKFVLEDYEYAEGFNRRIKGKVLRVTFDKRLVTTITTATPST